MTHDDVAGALIGALVDEGQHVDEGNFTLDRKAALAKLRGYQLANPVEYLLILVEAAWAAEPTDKTRLLRIECRADTYVDFRGPSLDGAGLRDLFAAVFASTSGLSGEPLRRARVLQLIGLAVNNVLGPNVVAVTIDGFDADGAPLRLRISPTGELALVDERPEPPLGAGWIRVQIHSDAGFTRGFAERDLVSQRCRYASFPIHVDGRLVSKQAMGRLTGRKPVTLDQRSVGEAGWKPSPGPAEVWVVNRGVEVALPDPQLPEGMFAIVRADLPMDLSRSQLVDGPELGAIRAALQQARDQLGAPPRQYSRPEPATMGTGALIWNAIIGVAFIAVVISMLQDCG